MLDTKVKEIREELEKLGFMTKLILPDVNYPGICIYPTEEKKALYLDLIFKAKGRKWVMESVHTAGFMVIEKNIIFPVKKHEYLGIYNIFENVEGNIFWHRDDVDQDDEFIDKPLQFMRDNKNPLQDFIYKKKHELISVFHCPSPQEFRNHHSWTGVCNKVDLVPILEEIVEKRDILREQRQYLPEAIKYMQQKLYEHSFNPQDFAPLDTDIKWLFLARGKEGLEWESQTKDSIQETAMRLGNKAYWHKYQELDQTLLVSNKNCYHARWILDSSSPRYIMHLYRMDM